VTKREPNRPTELSRFVRDFRERSGYSQSELLVLLNRELPGHPLPPKYVSIVETGARLNLEARFFSALSKLSGQSIERLQTQQRIPIQSAPASGSLGSPPPSYPVRIACGHVIWAAPILAAAIDGRLPGISIATFAESKMDAELLSADKAVWVESGKWPVLPRDLEGLRMKVPAPLRKEESPSWPLSARDVLRWLREGNVDIIGVPGGLVEHNRDFMRIGRIVDSATGCTLVCSKELSDRLQPNERATWPYQTVTTDQLCATLSAGDSAWRIGAEEGTVAWQFLEAACMKGGRDLSDIPWDCPNRVLTTSSFGMLQSRLRSEMRDDDIRLAGVVTWEPHASWLIDQSEEEPRAFPMQLSPNHRGEPRHLTFDLFILRRRSEDPLLGRVVDDLLWKSWQAAIELQQLSSATFNPHMKALSAYYSVGGKSKKEISENLTRMIGGCRFAVSMDIENQHEFPHR